LAFLFITSPQKVRIFNSVIGSPGNPLAQTAALLVRPKGVSCRYLLVGGFYSMRALKNSPIKKAALPLHPLKATRLSLAETRGFPSPAHAEFGIFFIVVVIIDINNAMSSKKFITFLTKF
jgi:hypothetical protein